MSQMEPGKAGSAADAVSPAIERTKQLLFPFKGEKWFALGFTVFMAQCTEGGGQRAFFQIPNLPGGTGPRTHGSGSGGGGLPHEFQEFIDKVTRALTADLAFYVGMAIGFVLALVALWMFVVWFSSRAKLMFVESVIWDRVDVSAQWTRAAELSSSLFKFRALFGLAGSVLMLASVGTAIFVAFPDWQAGALTGPRALIGYSVLAAGFLVFGFPASIVLALLDDFVVPLMVVRNVRVGAAWGIARTEVFAGHVGGIILFYFLRFMLAIAAGIAASLVMCFTCCIGYIPYIGTVLLLPISVFMRAYPLFYLEQLGVRVFPAPDPGWAYYDQWRFPQ